MRLITRVFTVTPESWQEHLATCIAAINDPMAVNERLVAKRQAAIAEIAGIRPGDRLFFYIQRSKELLAGFEAITSPYFDSDCLYDDATVIDERFPLRVGFRRTMVFQKNIHINNIWASRDKGTIWTMQQARGDAIGRHACWGLTNLEGDMLYKMFLELNPVIHESTNNTDTYLPEDLQPLPISTNVIGQRFKCMQYEHALQALLLEDFADGLHKNHFGNYSDFLSFVPTSSGREIDLVLSSYLNNTPLWYQIVELKRDRFTWEDLQQILDYEVWLTSGQAKGNPRAVHMVAIANRFDDDVINFLIKRKEARLKPLRIFTYQLAVLSVTPRIRLDEIIL